MGFGSTGNRMSKTKQSLAHCGVRGAWGFPPAPPLALADELLKQFKMLLRTQVDPEWLMPDAGVVCHPTAPVLGLLP